MLDEERTLLEIMVLGNPVLTRKAEEIQNIDDHLMQLANDMIYTMHAAPGIGLAAPQINRSLRLITVDLSVGEKNEEIIILANPELLSSEGVDIMEEGCLSVPEVHEKVDRPLHVVVKGIDLEGKERIIDASGLLARVLCHEIDHLNGKLFIDHLSPLKKNMIKKKFKKQKDKGPGA
ncbi:MAG: peptide deformylase [Candidatus Aminicenantes bacterium]|nr:peptide deformylase [Candidatus Aminicenantes bacterium]